MSIRKAFKELAEDSGKEHAVTELQQVQVTLEMLCEVGDSTERDMASHLLHSVCNTLNELVSQENN